ncbi:MAG: hypothetical protein KDC54_00990 [Lewinella sp.]|nr:hypothetical protein [Lewinella sp.]
MKNLLEIAGIVTKKKVKKIEIFDEYNLKNKNSKFNEFYEALSGGKFKNDRDAAAALYGCSPKDARYRQLKSRFRRRLLNTLFFLDVNKPSASNYDRAHFTCHKEWTLVKILQDNNAHTSAAALARSILTTALKFRFSEIIVNCSRILRQYATLEGNSKDFEMYDQYVKEYSHLLEGEIRSEELYQRVIMDYYHPSTDSNDLKDLIDTYGNTLLSLSEIHDSPLIFFNTFLVWAMKYEMNRDYQALLEVCEQAESYIDSNPMYYQEERLIDFFTKKMSAFLHMSDYTQGQVNAEKCLQRFPEGSEPWFGFMEYYLLLALHTSQYIQALAIYNQTVTQRQFAKLNSNQREKWSMYEVFILYLIQPMGMAGRLATPARRRPLQMEQYLNQNFNYPPDQRILTVLHLIAQVFFLLGKRDHARADERIDLLQNLANRTLAKDEYHRPIQFIRLLLQLRKANYQPEELRNTEKYLKRLQEAPFSYRGSLSQLEPVPYELMWQQLLRRLG